jgi:hypothetical protein
MNGGQHTILVTCTTVGCRNYHHPVRIWPAVLHNGYLAWSRLTCAFCGCEPKTVTDEGDGDEHAAQ